MEGPKRLPFTTLGPPGKQEKKSVTPKTHRFDLDLTESTDTTCPEFFYTDLLKTIPVSHQNVLARCTNDFPTRFNKEMISFHSNLDGKFVVFEGIPFPLLSTKTKYFA